MTIIITDKERWKILTKKIFKAQIVLDGLKEVVKIGQKNIRKLREEKEKLKDKTPKDALPKQNEGGKE